MELGQRTEAAPPDDQTEAVGENGHERGKALRRQLILAAAREMIAEQGPEGLAMRTIAARAGLSPVTVYNLFGSKLAILKALYAEEYRNLVAWFEPRASADPLVRLFDLIDLSTEFYSRHLAFYKTLFANLIADSRSEISLTDWAVRTINMRGLLSAAIDSGQLRPDTPADILASIFIRIGKATSQEWVDDTLTAEQARVEIGVAMLTILENYGTAESRQQLATVAQRYRPS